MPQRLRPLSGLDAGFLYLEAAGTPMHVGSVMLLRPHGRRDFHRKLVAHMRERLPRAHALRRVLRAAPLDLGHPMWSESASLNLDQHVRKQRLGAPGTLAQLWRLVADLHAEPLPRDRPLWEFVVIDGLASGEVALYSKVHHALLDGQGGMALAQALLDVRPTRPQRQCATPHDVPAPARLRKRDMASVSARFSAQTFVKLIRELPASLKSAAGAVAGAVRLGSLRDAVLLAPRTVFNVQVGPRRSFAVASLPLDDVKTVARHFGASFNDVVMALCAGALRGYLMRRKALPRTGLVAAMPVSLRAAGNTEMNNQVSMVQCALPTDIADPVARLRAITATTGRLKLQVAAFRSLIPTDFPGFAAPIWAPGLSRLWASARLAERLPPLANLVVSNVPGPPAPLYLAGTEILHYFPVSIVTHGLGLNITVNSYAGHLEFGLLACRDIAPKLDSMASGLTRALRQLLVTVKQ